MKDNTQKAKQLLQQAMREMPQDFALSEARYHLNAALVKIEQIEQKRHRRHQQELDEQRRQTEQMNVGPVMNVRETLGYIDDMIANERKKIVEIQERRKQRQQPQEDDEEPLLG